MEHFHSTKVYFKVEGDFLNLLLEFFFKQPLYVQQTDTRQKKKKKTLQSVSFGYICTANHYKK